MDLKNKTVVITGGGSGIGRATALLFAKFGAFVIVCGRHEESLRETQKIINDRGYVSYVKKLDITDVNQVKTLSNIYENYGKTHILVNNAGIGLSKPLHLTTEYDWDNVINTNLKGTFLVSKTVIPFMDYRGIIMNVSSELGLYGSHDYSAYCASKFGIIGLTKSLALEYPYMKFYSICPSSTYTDMHRNLVGEENAKMAQSPEKVAKVMVELAQKENKKSGSSILIQKPKAVFYWDLLKRKLFK